MERRFARRLNALEEIVPVLEAFFVDNDIGRNNLNDALLIIDELFTNLVRHNTEGRHEISLKLDRRGDDLVITLTDFDVHCFDVTRAPEVDTSIPLDQRRPGGLGIHFVRAVADEFSYEHDGRNSRITVIKHLET